MARQSRLVLLLLLTTAVVHAVQAEVPLPDLHDDITDNELDVSGDIQPVVKNPSGIKISTPKIKDLPPVVSTVKNIKESSTSPTTHKPVNDEILKDLIEAAKHSVALADDPRFNKMLPEKLKKHDHSGAKKHSEEAYDDEYDNYDYDEDYNYDENTSSETELTKHPKTKSSTTHSPATIIAKSSSGKTIEMKPIKENKKKFDSIDDQKNNNIDDTYDDYKHTEDEDDEDEDTDTDDDDSDNDEEEEVLFSENVPCPRYCVCARNINSYLVATCSRLDPGTQKFGSDITDLIVTDAGPKYPILLGPKFFVQMGLKHISSIKISNCTIEYLDPAAFHGLDEIFSVNLTNVGLNIINAETFAKNKKLRMLTISGNDLMIMSNVKSLIKSATIEELDLSRNNLMELNPSAFSQLTNIVYINLAQNNLQNIPHDVFVSLQTLEELDLSYNTLKDLPHNIFDKTALSILHLKYNSFTGNLSFGNEQLQQLDLSFNNINSIHHGMLDKMTGLTNLNLKGNSITKIQADSFLTLKNLRHIDLSINELDQISNMVFYKNSELDVIRLNDNPQLSQLPTDGFRSYNGYFTAYYLDISNCAIGALGHKTFSTMPYLTTLKLAWNNINNLERDTFQDLNKLIDLDLSNNLIARLDDLTFMKNYDITKLNLAGNPLTKLSVRLFLALNQLRELDVSECELTSLLADHQYGVGDNYKFFETLRSFNASANQIKHVSSDDIKKFKTLRTLDLTNNPLECDEDFQEFISYVSLHTKMVTNRVPTLANIESAVTFSEFQPHAGWAQLAHTVCKHHESMNPISGLNERIESAEHELDEDAKHLLNIVEKSDPHKVPYKVQKLSESSEIKKIDGASGKSEDDLNNAEEDKDDEAENESDYDEEDDDDNDEEENENNGGKVDEKNIKDDFDYYEKHHLNTAKGKDASSMVNSDEAKNKFLWNKFNRDGDLDDNNVEEEIIIQRGHVYYSGYRFFIPVIVMIVCVVVLLLIIAKVVAMVMHKRGERYRMALLASHKNSIVYQKLSEEIKPKSKEPKQPKVHRYSPINQV